MGFRRWRRNWMVLTALVVHAIWGIILLLSDAPLHTTPLADFPIKHHYVAGVFYLVACAMAVVPVFWKKYEHGMLGLFLTLPQQFLLMLSALTGVMCGFRGSYPDGYVPAYSAAAFIWVDQAWAIIGMFAHTASLVDWYWFAPTQFHCAICPSTESAPLKTSTSM